jgi:micrococcal nuclease
MNSTKLLLIALVLFPSQQKGENSGLPHKIWGKVISVKDGDTIGIFFKGQPLEIRFAHIDCPEMKKRQPFGKAAKQFTSAMCFGQTVLILNENRFDRYKRLIGIVINNKGQNINKELLKAGLAWHFKKYSTDQAYAALENEARLVRTGLWADKNPLAPWSWRHH